MPKYFDIRDMADDLINTALCGQDLQVNPEEVYTLVRHLPEERQILKSLEEKVGGIDNLVLLCAAAVCGPGGKDDMRTLIKQFDDMLTPASYHIDFVALYEEASKMREAPEYTNNVAQFPKK